MKEIKLIDSKPLFDHPWAQIYLDIVEIGGIHHKYFYLVSPEDAVVTLGITSKNEIILTRQYRHPIGQIIYDLPGGRLEPGENPLEGARREFEEETGFFPGHIERLGYYNQFPGMIRAATNMFFARDLIPTRQNLDEGEELKVILMPVGEVMELIMEEKIIDGSLQLAVLMASQKGLLK